MSDTPQRPAVLVMAMVAAGWMVGLIAILFLATVLQGDAETVAPATSWALLPVPALVAAAAFRFVVSGSSGPVMLATLSVFVAGVAVTFLFPAVPFGIVVAPLSLAAFSLFATRLLDRR